MKCLCWETSEEIPKIHNKLNHFRMEVKPVSSFPDTKSDIFAKGLSDEGHYRSQTNLMCQWLG